MLGLVSRTGMASSSRALINNGPARATLVVGLRHSKQEQPRFLSQLPHAASPEAPASPSTSTSPATASEPTPQQPVSAQQPAPAKDDVSGPMLEPSAANTPLAKALVPLAATAAAVGSTAFIPGKLVAFLHVTSFALWLGSNIWNTFFVGLTMFKNMPRQMFGRVQSVLFPKYFALTTGCNAVLLGSLLLPLASSSTAPSPATTSAAAVLGVGLLCSVGNFLLIEPKTTKLMFQRYDIENKPNKTEDDKNQIQALYKQFGKWHGISSLLNLIITGTAVSHGWYLAGALTL
ncbi:hypothetical protein DUNSADRAFT_4495 [Dunaliella salina]|uniref:TMEM205-like domain-containing protein n=1 Tax=Dunaliella salina TaxID=3046 RepID=A0ABQ7GRX4_DUNSA|nr:hypothetical protein DUNSADRAFT_4495 [Dunaliella salina]|eukprot:KAF5837336.1 hypothetical protein DUNSADRAFT_4495 [Dunaliella salina]